MPQRRKTAGTPDASAFRDAAYGEPLMTFARPDRAVRERLDELLAGLPIEPFRQAELETFRPEQAVLRGRRGDVLDAVMGELESDYADNLVESGAWDGGFDYVIVDSIFVAGGIEVLTRLYYHDGPGRMYYGRLVQRAAGDEYLMWVTA